VPHKRGSAHTYRADRTSVPQPIDFDCGRCDGLLQIHQRDASDLRDIGFEIEEASRTLSSPFNDCTVEVIDLSDDGAPLDWVRVQLRANALGNCEEAGNGYFAELSGRGIVPVRE